MGVGDAGDPRWPFLAPEIALLRKLVARDAPVLGICLGSQLLAAGGGRARLPEHAARHRRRPVPRARSAGARSTSSASSASRRSRACAPQALVLHWHGDTFDLPPGAVHLASTPVCRHQAFRLGRRQFGLQFHCELERRDDRRLGARGRRLRARRQRPDGGGARSSPTPSATTPRRAPGLGSPARQRHRSAASRDAIRRLTSPGGDNSHAVPRQHLQDRVSSRCAARPIRPTTWRARRSSDPRGRRRRRRAGRLPARAVPHASTSARPRTTPNFDLAEPIPGPTTEALARRSRARRGVVVIGSLFERRAAGVYHNTAVVLDADGTLLRQLPQDAHPRRSALLREVLLHARRPRVPRLRHARAAASARWSAGTSGTPRARG